MTKKTERLNYGENPCSSSRNDDTEHYDDAAGNLRGPSAQTDGASTACDDTCQDLAEAVGRSDGEGGYADGAIGGPAEVRGASGEMRGVPDGEQGVPDETFSGTDIPSADYMQGYQDTVDDLCDARCGAEAEAYEDYCRERSGDAGRDDEVDAGQGNEGDVVAGSGTCGEDGVGDADGRWPPEPFPGDVHNEGDSLDALPSSEIGRRGETAACQLLKRKGYTILERNWTCPAGEADIVALDDDCIVFVEVKTRTNIEYGLPGEAITPSKRARYEKIAAYYLADHEGPDARVRFDAVSLLVVPNHRALARHVINAFGSGM